MTFVVDTGSEITMICPPDSMDLDLSSLRNSDTMDAIKSDGTRTRAMLSKNCRFNYVYGESFNRTLEFIAVELPHKSGNVRDIINSSNILGMDFLEDFKISFRNDCVYLETEKN